MAHTAPPGATVRGMGSRFFGVSLLLRFFGLAEAPASFIYAAYIRMSIRFPIDSPRSRFFGRPKAHRALISASVPRLSNRLARGHLRPLFGEGDKAPPEFLYAVVPRLGGRFPYEHSPSRIPGWAGALNGFANAIFSRRSSRFYGYSLDPQLCGRARAPIALLRSVVLRLRSLPPVRMARRPFPRLRARSSPPYANAQHISGFASGLVCWREIPSWRITRSLNSCVGVGWASSASNNRLVRSMMQQIRGTPRPPGFTGDENTCAVIRKNTHTMDGRMPNWGAH